MVGNTNEDNLDINFDDIQLNEIDMSLLTKDYDDWCNETPEDDDIYEKDSDILFE